MAMNISRLSPWSHVVAIGSIAFLLAACGEGTTTEKIVEVATGGMDVVASVDELPKCTKDNEGEQAFVKGENSARICVDGKWFATKESVKDTVVVAGDTVYMQGGRDTVVLAGDTVILSKLDTIYVNGGDYSCSSNELADGSGLKIICNGDSIGVVKNGVAGSNGEDGNDGVGCSIVSQTDSTVTVKCGEGSFTMNLNGGSGASVIDTGDVTYEVENASISGVSQKGPFVKGATVTAFELDGSRSLLQTGRTFSGNITQDDGRFNMSNVTLKSSYVLLSANGYYRNEVTGKNSTSPITLNAVTDLYARNTVNVNLLTHLEYDRVAHLMRAGDGTLKIKLVKKQAEKEIFNAFYIDATGFGYSEDLDVFGNTEADAALLAISILLQGDRGEAELTELLTSFSTDFSTDSSWDDLTKRAEIADSALSKDAQRLLATYRNNVRDWGLSTTVPYFEKYIRRFASIENGLGVCGSDSTPVGFVKHVTNKNSKTYYAASYTDATNKTRFICADADSAKWRVATDIEKDTMGWSTEFKNAKDGDVHNGKVNSNKTYVFQNNSWRLGTAMDSLFVKESDGKACLANGDTSTIKYNNVYYVCTANTDGAVRGWKKAPDIYNDTYESRKECSKTGIYSDGTILTGRVTGKKYVCDAGEFRGADSTELYWNRGCVYDFYGTSVMFDGQYSYYKCSAKGWQYDFDNLNQGTVTYGGQTYKTIGIKTQYWMAENLNYEVEGQSHCLKNSADSCAKYGRLYTWAAAVGKSEQECGLDTSCGLSGTVRGVCPEGWHLPSINEWQTLYSAMGNNPYAMQAKGFENWPDASDDYGFSALPAGGSQHYGKSFDVGDFAFFWFVSEYNRKYSYRWHLRAKAADYNMNYKDSGYSVRCLKD